MGDFKQRVLDARRLRRRADACAEQDAELCPSIALPDLFGDRSRPGPASAVEGVLDLLPPYFLARVRQPRPGRGALGDTAVIPFGIKVMPFDEQKELIDSIRAEIDPPGTANDPPAGRQRRGRRAAGARRRRELGAREQPLPADARRARRRRAGAARDLPLAAPGAGAADPDRPRDRLVGARPGDRRGAAEPDVGDARGAGDRDRDRVQRPARGPLSRRSARGGVPVGEALRRAYSRTGMAVLASGITAIAGFAALIATDIRMLRDFGLVTVLDLSVALLGVLRGPAGRARLGGERRSPPFGARAARFGPAADPG